MELLMKTAILDALEARYDAQIAEADATIKIYLENSVGIGEHPQHLEEMDILLENMTSAHDKLEILHRYFKDDNFKGNNFSNNFKQISLSETTEIKNNNYPIRTDDLD